MANTDEEIIFRQCVEDVNEFYTFYEDTEQDISISAIIHNLYQNDFLVDPDTKRIMRYVDPQKSDGIKVYIRLYQPTGHWYIGHTTKISARDRHLAEIENVIQRRYMKNIPKTSKVIQFYEDVFDDEYDDEDFVIYTIATVRDTATARTIEDKLIKHFTHKYNETSLPIELCLNTYLVSDNLRTLHL